jgi:hypothetical protein
LTVGYRKKFAADKLQRSYDAFANAYGYTKDQVKDALKRLEDKNLIDLEFRHPVINDVKYGNLLFIGLNVDRLAEVSTPLSPLNPIGYEDKSTDPLTFKGDTNTETTTETTTVKKRGVRKSAAPKETKPALHNGKPLTDIPELVLYRGIVAHWPTRAQRQIVISVLQQVCARLGRDVTADDLQPFWLAWCKVSKNDWSLTWLDWAVAGRVLGYGEKLSQQPSSSPAPVVYSQADIDFAAEIAASRAQRLSR